MNILRIFFTGIIIFLIASITLAQETSSTNEDKYSSLINKSSHIELDSLIDNYYKIFRSYDVSFHEKYINEIIDKSRSINHLTRLSDLYNKIGVIQRNNALYDRALTSHLKALSFAQNNSLSLIKSNNYIGVVYRRLDKPRLALTYHMKAMSLIDIYQGDQKDIIKDKCMALNSVGNLNMTLEQPHQALIFLKMSLALEKKQKNPLGIAINYHNIGCAYQALRDSVMAMKYYYKSLSENTKIHSALGKTICYNTIGRLYLERSQFKKAKNAIDSALFFSKNLNDLYHSTQTYANLVRINLKMKNIRNAHKYLRIFKREANMTGSRSLIYEYNILFSDYFSQVGKADSALIYYKRAVSHNDSIINEKNGRYLNEIQTIYQSEKKEQRIELLTAENKIKSQSVVLFIALCIVLILAIVIGFLDFVMRKKRNIQRHESLKQQLLRSQMNPHFLFNALGSIQNFMYKNENRKAASYLNMFASLTRSILEQSAKESIPLADEIDTLRNYLELEQMRMQNSFDYKLSFDDSLDTEFIMIPPMLIQPFVENAIKHGLKNISYRGSLIISFKEENDFLLIDITDNGHGINSSFKNKTKGHQSMSMDIFNERCKILSKETKNKLAFTIIDRSDMNAEDKGTLVKVKLLISAK